MYKIIYHYACVRMSLLVRFCSREWETEGDRPCANSVNFCKRLLASATLLKRPSQGIVHWGSPWHCKPPTVKMSPPWHAKQPTLKTSSKAGIQPLFFFFWEVPVVGLPVPWVTFFVLFLLFEWWGGRETLIFVCLASCLFDSATESESLCCGVYAIMKTADWQG